jgi:hypothetical protein
LIVGCGDSAAAVSAKVETAVLTEGYIHGVAIK